jgi:type IV pilus assembly protein PilC
VELGVEHNETEARKKIMPFFKYTVKNEHGETVKGKVEAPTQQQAASILRTRGLLVITVQPEQEDIFGTFQSALFGIKKDDVVNFTRQLSTMITAGVPLTEALLILQQESKPAMQKLLNDLLRDIEGGSTFSKALEKQEKVFSRIYVQLVRAGETAGALDRVLSRLADNLEKQKEFRAKTRGALIYPVIVVIAMIAVALIMMIFVVPKLSDMYKELGATLPLMTRGLIGISNFFIYRWWLILILGIGGGFGFRQWHKTHNGQIKFDKFMFKLPIIGVLRQKIILTEFARTLSLLLGAGISLIQTLEIISDATDSVIYREAFKKATDQVEKGVPLSQSVSDHEIFPTLLSQMIAVGEETGKIDEVMLKLSLYFEAESEHAVKNMTTAIEPLIMIVLGVGVGILVVSIILPIYNLTSQF